MRRSLIKFFISIVILIMLDYFVFCEAHKDYSIIIKGVDMMKASTDAFIANKLYLAEQHLANAQKIFDRVLELHINDSLVHILKAYARTEHIRLLIKKKQNYTGLLKKLHIDVQLTKKTILSSKPEDKSLNEWLTIALNNEHLFDNLIAITPFTSYTLLKDIKYNIILSCEKVIEKDAYNISVYIRMAETYKFLYEFALSNDKVDDSEFYLQKMNKSLANIDLIIFNLKAKKKLTKRGKKIIIEGEKFLKSME